MKVAINGFGRIGRSVFRILDDRENVDVVAINDIFDKGALTYLLKYDTVMGRFPGEVTLDGDMLKTENQSVKLLAEREPSSLPWNELGVDIGLAIICGTIVGVFTTTAGYLWARFISNRITIPLRYSEVLATSLL